MSDEKKCPKCGHKLIECDCPIDGPGEGVYCPECGWNHLDSGPWWLVKKFHGRLDREKAKNKWLREQMTRAANSIKTLAFEIPAPNRYTPQFASIAMFLTNAVHTSEATNGVKEGT